MSSRVLIIGGYGVFGGRLARRLVRDTRFEVLVAGRSQDKADAFCRAHGGTPVTLDLADTDLTTRIGALAPFVIIDAAGPFQSYQSEAVYRLAKVAIACGAHYLDLSDDAGFTEGIATLDGEAKAANVSVLSGVSSVPALSSSIVTALSKDMSDIHQIETAILPGNKAPRGLSVVRAIVAQAGRPMRVWQDSQWRDVTGWGGRITLTLSLPGERRLKGRWASLIGAPDLALFPMHFKARTVLFRAGLDLKLMHGGLALLSVPVRWGWCASIAPLSPLLKWIADRLEPFGSARGGMQVRVTGRTRSGHNETRLWTLIVDGGDGPFIPALPAEIMCAKLRAGDTAPGARPALGVFTQAEAQTALATLRLKTHIEITPRQPLFDTCLGTDFTRLPAPLQDLHTVLETRRWVGKASVQRGTGFLARLAGWFAGFPPSTDETRVEVRMARTPKGEVWTRRFGGHTFRSYLSQSGPNGQGTAKERFGLLSFTIALSAKDGQLAFPVTRGTCLGVPLSSFMLPKSDTREYVDAEGRAAFDVSIALPIAGHVVTYRGYLEDAGA